MSAVSESSSRRMTLGDLVTRHGFELDPPFATGVTITCLADDVDSVRPGALYVTNAAVSQDQLDHVRRFGAYGALVPRSMKGQLNNSDIPVMYADPTAHQIGIIADEIAGSPSTSLAVFAVAGTNAEAIRRDVRELADFLHMLGNPVGVICAAESQSLDRYLDLEYPLGIFDMQRTLAVCAEDGAAAVVIAMDDDTLRDDALRSVTVDVIGAGTPFITPSSQSITHAQESCVRYGCDLSDGGRIVTRTRESDSLASQSSLTYDADAVNHLSLAISMTMAAGVRKANIKSALRVSRELR